jgi:hypothetical protein
MKLSDICNRLCMVLMLLILGIHLGGNPYGQLSNELFRYQIRVKRLPPENLAALVDRKKVQALTPAEAATYDAQVKTYVAQLKAFDNLVTQTDAELSHLLHTQAMLNYLLTLAAVGLCFVSVISAAVESRRKSAAAAVGNTVPVTP